MRDAAHIGRIYGSLGAGSARAAAAHFNRASSHPAFTRFREWTKVAIACHFLGRQRVGLPVNAKKAC